MKRRYFSDEEVKIAQETPPEGVEKETKPREEEPEKKEIEPELFTSPEPETKEPDFLAKLTPMDVTILTNLNKERENALRTGDIEKLKQIEKQVIDLLNKYTMIVTPQEMSPESFVARRLQGHIGLRRNLMPIVSSASSVFPKLSRIFNIVFGQIGLLKMESDEYDPVPEKGSVEFVVRMKPCGVTSPYRVAIIRVDVTGKDVEIIPYIWDTSGRRYSFDTSGLEMFFGMDNLKEIEKQYLDEEREFRKKIDSGEIKPNVYGLGRETPGISDKGISQPTTSF